MNEMDEELTMLDIDGMDEWLNKCAENNKDNSAQLELINYCKKRNAMDRKAIKENEGMK